VIWLAEMTVSGLKCLDGATITFEPSGCTAIVGANNSGKSSVLRALRLFFEQSAAITGTSGQESSAQRPQSAARSSPTRKLGLVPWLRQENLSR
jgi:predicted ATP-dependent endonuclease of OLD family